MMDRKPTNNTATLSPFQLKPLRFARRLVFGLLALGFEPLASADPTTAAATNDTANQPSAQHLDKAPARLASYHSTLQNHEAEGPYHQNSSEVLYSLGLELQKGGQHGKALKALRRSMHINRVNSGCCGVLSRARKT